ncbi:MAG: hypothetical protein ABJH63_14715 [Rhizobiaceae bacterium]
MQTPQQPNPVDDICKQLSLADLLANTEQPELHQNYAEKELDGLYEFAKIIWPIIQQRPTLQRAAELLLQSVGLHVKHPSMPEFVRGSGPHIFIANHPGCCLVDAAIGTRMIARLGLTPAVVDVKHLQATSKSDELIEFEYPRIQQNDPRSDAQIAAANARSVLKMRKLLAKERGLLLFPSTGLYSSTDGGRLLLDRSFDRLAPVLLACKDLQPKVHLLHFDYELPFWWTQLYEHDQAQFFA